MIRRSKQRTFQSLSSKGILLTLILMVWAFSILCFWGRDHLLLVLDSSSSSSSLVSHDNTANRNSMIPSTDESSSVISVRTTTKNTTTTFSDDIELTPYIRQELKGVLRRYPQECTSKQHALAIILQSIGRTKAITSKQCKALPSDEQVSARYGPDPVVVGMDTCETFRQNVKRAQQHAKRHVAATVRVAGLYNTGTNALAQSFVRNLQQDHKVWDTDGKTKKRGVVVGKGIKWAEYYSVPWEKHVPPKYRGKHTVPQDRWVDLNTVLPIVLVRDPYHWMQSMCKQSYDATWNKSGGDRCPNLLLPNSNEPNPVRVNWESKFPENYGSLVQLWNDWNKAYVQAAFPRLLIRYEDMLWHGEKVLELIAECAGIPRRQPFSFRYGASKTHGHSGNLVTSLQKLLAPSRQLMTPRNAEFAQHQLNKELMELFQYTGSSSTTTTSSVESFSSMPMPRGRSPLPARQKPKFKGKWS